MIDSTFELRGTAAILAYARKMGYLQGRSIETRLQPSSKMLDEYARKLHWTHLAADRFKSAKGTEFSLTNVVRAMHENDLSGVLDCDVEGVDPRAFTNEVICRTPEELCAIRELAKLVCHREEVQLLEKACSNLQQLKNTMLEQFGFAKDGGKLLEMLSFAALVINHPLAFGASSRDDTGGRSALLLEIQNYINEKWPLQRGRNLADPCWFPIEAHAKIAATFNEAGFPFTFKPKEQKFAGIFIAPGTRKVAGREAIQLPVRGYIVKCLLPPTNSDGVCINDEAPNYFKSLFPPGFHLIRSDFDEDSFEATLKKLGTFAKEIFKQVS